MNKDREAKKQTHREGNRHMDKQGQTDRQTDSDRRSNIYPDLNTFAVLSNLLCYHVCSLHRWDSVQHRWTQVSALLGEQLLSFDTSMLPADRLEQFTNLVNDVENWLKRVQSKLELENVNTTNNKEVKLALKDLEVCFSVDVVFVLCW